MNINYREAPLFYERIFTEKVLYSQVWLCVYTEMHQQATPLFLLIYFLLPYS